MKASDILELAQECDQIKAEIEQLEAKRRTKCETLDREFRRRGATSVPHGGKVVTMKGRNRYDVDVDVVRAGAKRPVFARITKLVVVRDLAQAEVKAGNLDADLLEQATTSTESARWPVVSDAKAA